ncbi:MAG: hypothetical protein Q9187_000335 [Circinaria calcarea]
MDAKAAQAAAAMTDQEVSQKLKDAKKAAKNAPGMDGSKRVPEKVLETGEKSVAGRKKMRGGEKWDVSTGKESAESEEEVASKTNEEKDVDVELNAILKRSPIIIFSKSYCPYSRKAKEIFEKYKIVPSPFIVELDMHPMGTHIQAALEKSTNRKTVPNVLIAGKSIGGGDDVEALHNKGELISKIKEMGGKRMMEVRLIDA